MVATLSFTPMLKQPLDLTSSCGTSLDWPAFVSMLAAEADQSLHPVSFPWPGHPPYTCHCPIKLVSVGPTITSSKLCTHRIQGFSQEVLTLDSRYNSHEQQASNSHAQTSTVLHYQARDPGMDWVWSNPVHQSPCQKQESTGSPNFVQGQSEPSSSGYENMVIVTGSGTTSP